MHDTSARLVERVLPAASYRRWVLTVPFPLRLRIARDPGELSRVLNRFSILFPQARQLPQAGGVGGAPCSDAVLKIVPVSPDC